MQHFLLVIGLEIADRVSMTGAVTVYQKMVSACSAATRILALAAAPRILQCKT